MAIKKGDKVPKSQVDIMKLIREILEPECNWLDSKGAKLEPSSCVGIEELDRYGKVIEKEGIKRYGVIAGGIYLEEKIEEYKGVIESKERYRPQKGVLIGIRGKGRKLRSGYRSKNATSVENKRFGNIWQGRKIVKLDNMLRRLYEREEKIRRIEVARGVVEECVRGDVERRLEGLDKLVRSIVLGSKKRIEVIKFRSKQSEIGIIGKRSSERFLVWKKVWVEIGEEGEIIVKYAAKWEHIGNMKDWRKGSIRFIKESKENKESKEENIE